MTNEEIKQLKDHLKAHGILEVYCKAILNKATRASVSTCPIGYLLTNMHNWAAANKEYPEISVFQWEKAHMEWNNIHYTSGKKVKTFNSDLELLVTKLLDKKQPLLSYISRFRN